MSTESEFIGWCEITEGSIELALSCYLKKHDI